YGGFLRRI
nr:Chain P, Dynorphin [Homo sapiens]prf//0610285A dynorphin related 8-peptide [Sus scrofa domesticus]prf//2114374A dynorphin A 1-8 [Homo sapiens]